MHRFGVISNPYARTCRKNPGFNTDLRNLIGSKGIFRVTRSTAEIASALQEFKSNNVTCVGIVGGDGSINLVLAELLKLYPEASLPTILVLGGGTANVLAINLGVTSKPLKVMSDFLHVNSQNPGGLKTVQIPSLKINNRVGFIFANGVAARFLQVFYKNKGSAKDAALLLMKVLAQAALPKNPFKAMHPATNHLSAAIPMTLVGPASVLHWARKHPRVSTVFVSTLKSMALNIPVFQNLDGINAELLATSLEKSKLATVLGRILLRRPAPNPHVLQCPVAKLRVITTAGEPYTIDGELFDAPKEGVIIEIGTRFQFLTNLREARGHQNETNN